MRKLIAGMKISVDAKMEGPEHSADWVEAWSEDYDLTPQIDACLLGGGMYPGYEQYWTGIQNEPDTARDIARIIRVPLTVDIEGGYSSDPKAVAEVVARIIDVGAVGINLEDGASPTELLCAKIEAARKTAARVGVDLFINARTDVYLRAVATGDAAVEEVLRRAELYRAAGCDGIFVPCLVDGRAIEAIATAIDPLPLNIMLMPGLASVSELRRLGVRRLSAGAAIAQAALSLTSRLATDFLGGSCDSMFSMAADYNATNQLFRAIEEQPAKVQTRST